MDDNDTQALAHQQELEQERYLDETDFAIDREYYFSGGYSEKFYNY